MTAFRIFPLSAHGAVEMAAGLMLMAAPFVLGFGAAGTVTAVLIGALVVGVALSAVDTGERGGSISTHFALDYGLVLGLVGAALVLVVAGDPLAATVLAVAAAAQLALNLTTRYSARA